MMQPSTSQIQRFRELEQALDALGWRLDPLYGDALQAVHRQTGARQPCKDLDAAEALLRSLTSNIDTAGEKRFATLRAHAAQGGFELLRTHPADGPIRYFGVRWGVVREIGATLDLVEGFVRVMGGQS